MMALFVGTAVVRANRMSRHQYCTLRGWTVPAGEDPLDVGYLVEHVDGAPNVAGYAGFVTWQPAAVFEQTHPTNGAMNFSQALELLRRGNAIARAGWNGKGMFAYLVPANAYPASTSAAKAHYGNELVPYNAYMALKGADGRVSTWAPSGSDCLADDWMLHVFDDLPALGKLVPAKMADGVLVPMASDTPGMGY